MTDKKMIIKILSKTPDKMLKLSEMTLSDTKTLYKNILKGHKDKK